MPRGLTARADEAPADLGGMVLGLGVAEGKCGGLFRAGKDVRNAIGVAPDQGLRRQQVGGWKLEHLAAAGH